MKRMLLLLSAVALLICSPFFTASADPASYSVSMDDRAWESIDHEYCRFESKQHLLDEVSQYVQEIAAFTGKSNWQDAYPQGKVEFEIVFTEIGSHVEGGYYSYTKLIPRIFINRTMAEHDFWPLAHEITHLICPAYSSLSLREGLASCMQDEIGKNCSIFNYGMDVHALARHYLGDEYFVVTEAMGSTDLAECAALAAGEKRTAFYLCSHSFSKYLMEQYGIQSFMQLYDSPNLEKECRLIVGKDIKSLKDGWKKYIEEYSGKMTREEIDRQITETMALHGVEYN